MTKKQIKVPMVGIYLYSILDEVEKTVKHLKKRGRGKVVLNRKKHRNKRKKMIRNCQLKRKKH